MRNKHNMYCMSCSAWVWAGTGHWIGGPIQNCACTSCYDGMYAAGRKTRKYNKRKLENAKTQLVLEL